DRRLLAGKDREHQLRVEQRLAAVGGYLAEDLDVAPAADLRAAQERLVEPPGGHQQRRGPADLEVGECVEGRAEGGRVGGQEGGDVLVAVGGFDDERRQRRPRRMGLDDDLHVGGTRRAGALDLGRLGRVEGEGGLHAAVVPQGAASSAPVSWSASCLALAGSPASSAARTTTLRPPTPPLALMNPRASTRPSWKDRQRRAAGPERSPIELISHGGAPGAEPLATRNATGASDEPLPILSDARHTPADGSSTSVRQAPAVRVRSAATGLAA